MAAPLKRTHQLIIEEIERFKVETGTSWIDATLEYCSRNNIEPEAIVKVVKSSKVLLKSIESEALKLNQLKRTAEPAEE